MNEKLSNLKYIDIWNSLELEDYYKTDLHWKQENLIKTSNTIISGMNYFSSILLDTYLKSIRVILL